MYAFPMVKLCKAVILNFHKESPIRLKPKAEIHGTETHTAVSTFHHLYNCLRGQSEFQHLTSSYLFCHSWVFL